MATNGDSQDNTGVMRLAEHNKYISTGLGFSLHPTIESAVEDKKIRIAEVSQGLQSDTKPDNWEILSIKDVASAAIDAQDQHAFDVVAVRLLQSSLTGDNWSTALQNIISLVRPGGFVQWVDWDPLTVRVAGAKPGTSDQALRQLLQRYTDLLKSRNVGTTYKISNALRGAGFQDDDSDIYALVPDEAFTTNIAQGAVNVLRRSEVVDSEELDKLWSRVEEEIRIGGPLLWYDLWCHIARKPQS